jgi:hypothetical protein
MYETGFQPEFSFERAAQTLGLSRARDLWEGYKLLERKRDVEAIAMEECMARDAARRDYRVNEELGGAPQWRLAPKTYLDLYRQSLPEKGCMGGEFLDDGSYMKWWLKRNPQCRITARSGVIMSGWTPQVEAGYRLERASAEVEPDAIEVAHAEALVQREEEGQRLIVES